MDYYILSSIPLRYILCAIIVYSCQIPLGCAVVEDSRGVIASQVEGQRGPFPDDESTQKIIKRHVIYDEAEKLVEVGQYEAAIAKYKEALNPKLLNYWYDAGGAHGSILDLYRLIGKYELAMRELKWYMKHNPHGTGWLDDKLELEALIRARDTGSMQPVYEHIAYLRKKYKNQLPPKDCPAGICDIIASTIIRLYDVIGDFEGGIKFVDSFINSYAKWWGVDPDNIGSQNGHYQIKQAFLQDKAEGRGSCLGVAPNDQCPGRATRFLIQSDEFPW